jgi:hypothetical protein
MTIGETGTTDAIVNFVNLILPDFGLYSINVHVNEELGKATTFLLGQMPIPR